VRTNIRGGCYKSFYRLKAIALNVNHSSLILKSEKAIAMNNSLIFSHGATLAGGHKPLNP